MKRIWGQAENHRSTIKFNIHGQPIENTSSLTHFLGTVARNGNYAPLRYRNWRKLPYTPYKEDMLKLVQVF